MSQFADIYSFESLYAAHCAARRGKQGRREVADFELNLGLNLIELSRSLENGNYRMLPYIHFVVEDPKRRLIHALHYRDRVVQHSLCDNIVGPILEPRLVYDSAACRKGKGTHFALDRLEAFLQEYYRKHGGGWFLKCDIHHFFASIDHAILKEMLLRPPFDDRTRCFLRYVIDSYEDMPGRGLPLGNQSSQWFALYYLDDIDRLVKERLHVRGYVRYMDDMILLHRDKAHLKECLVAMTAVAKDLKLSFNRKTQIAPLSQGIDFLGWHLYLTDKGRVVRRLKQSAKRRLLKIISMLDGLPVEERHAIEESYLAHLAHGDARGLAARVVASRRG